MKKENKIFLIICFGLVFLIYGQSLAGDFVFDDRMLLGYKGVLSNINNLFKVVAMPYWTVDTGLYRPVVLLSYAFNFIFLGSSPFWFHLVNLILYAFVGYLMFLLIRKLFPNKRLLAYLTSIIYLVLPIHTEVVANIIGRAEILALFFSLLYFLELLKEKPSPWRAGLWLLLAIGSKEVAIASLFLSFFVVFYKHKARFNKEILKKYYPSFLTSVVSGLTYITARFLVLGPYFFSNNATLVENPLKFVSFQERIFTALKVLTIYIKKTFWPFGLCSDYSYNQIPVVKSLLNIETLLGLLILLFFAVSFFVFLFKKPVLALGSLFFLAPFLPVSNLVFPIGTIAGERLMFYPSFGLCLYIGWILAWLITKASTKRIFKTLILVFVLGLVVFFSIRSIVRSFDWLTEERLFTSARKCAPNSVLSRSNFATIFYFKGDYDRAEKEILAAYQIYDKYSKAMNNLALIYWKKGEFEKAKKEYFRAIRNWPPYEGVYENLFFFYLSQNKPERAKKWLGLYYDDPKKVEEYIRIKYPYLIPKYFKNLQ